MKKSKFTEEPIAYALRQVESGTPPAEVCRQLGVSEATFCIWKKKYAQPVNKKRVRRLYRLDGLQLRMRVRRRKHIALHRGPAPTPTGPAERWSMDCVLDALADGRPFRVLTVVDQWSRQRPS